MLKNFVPLPWFMRKRIEPNIFRVFCPKCEYEETLEIGSQDVVVHENPDCDHSNAPRMVAELPKACPKCGAKLKKEKIPVIIRY